jgi:hypothetical protein
MNMKNTKINSLGYQLATIIIQLMLLLLLNIHLYIYYWLSEFKNNGNNYNKVVSLG